MDAENLKACMYTYGISDYLLSPPRSAKTFIRYIAVLWSKAISSPLTEERTGMLGGRTVGFKENVSLFW